jgi:hypothetical protein
MRYLDLLEQQLVDASRELSGASSGRNATKRISPFRALLQRHTALSAAAAVLALAATSGAIAAGILRFPDLTAPSPLGQTHSIPSDLASSFAVLRRDRQAGDALPGRAPGADTTDLGRHWGLNLNLSRLAGAVDGERIWLVPGNEGTCMNLADGSGACGPNDLVAAQGLVLMLVPVSGGAVTFIGVLPDGSSITATDANRSHHRVARAGAAFRISGDPNLREVTIHKRDGTRVKLRAR